MDGRKDKLEGWGEIESYLRISRPTIIRRNYPVKRKGGTVFARRAELDAYDAQLEAVARPVQGSQLQQSA